METFGVLRRQHGLRWRTFVNEADVDAWLAQQQANEQDDDLLGVGDAAKFIGCTLPALYRAIGDGLLQLEAGGIGNNQERKAARIRVSDAEHFKDRRTPPEGWLSVFELTARAHELGLEVPANFYWQLRHGHFPDARKYDPPAGWRLPPETLNRFARPLWTDMPKLTELLAEHHLTLTGTQRSQVTHALARGEIEGAIMANRHAGWRFPPATVPALLALARRQLNGAPPA